jgi:molecular chaperone GrpE
MAGQFVPNYPVGSILDTLTFANQIKKMAQKNMNQKQNSQAENIENDLGIDINTDENQSGTTHLNEPVSEDSDEEKIKSELNEVNDKFVRKVAEFENYKRRNAKERMELIQTAGKEVISDLLDVLDDCDRAQKQLETSNNINEIKEGVMLVFNKLRNKLYAKGLKPIESLYQDFNPDIHEAITQVPVSDEKLKGKVIDEVQKGYYLNDKIIRFPRVVVGK